LYEIKTNPMTVISAFISQRNTLKVSWFWINQKS